jgi:pre-mRNA-processing factor 6
MSRLIEQVRGTSQARATLEQARQANPNNPDLWLEAIRVEMRSGNKKLAQTLLAKALQECKHSGKLWAEAIEMESKPQKVHFLSHSLTQKDRQTDTQNKQTIS